MQHQHPHSFLRLAALLLAGSPAIAGAAEPPSWVFFADRGSEGVGLAAALDERATELAPRALDRRQRARSDRGVDVRDLPPAPAQVAAVLATGARLRSSSRWLNAVSVEADPAQLAAIAALPGVASLQPVARRRKLAAPPTPRSHPPRGLAGVARSSADDVDDAQYGVAREQLDLLQVPALHGCGLTGAGVVVGVQDSGFSLEHAALAGVKVLAAHDFLNDDDIVADEPGDPEGQHDHGTMILSLLAGDDPGNFMGAAPGISVILAKTEDHAVEEPFEEDRFVEGLEWIESMGADLFTSSLGYLDWYTPQDLDGATAVTTLAANVAIEQGLIMFGSVGNGGPNPMTLIAPSDADGLIAVGAVDMDGVVTEFSSRGPTADGRIKPDIVAPGRAVWIADPDSQADYRKGNGSSLATPLAAGAAALLLEAFPELDPAAMRSMLQQSASQADAPNNDVGWGLPDARVPLADRCACTDGDGDGALAVACGGTDCDDTDPAVHPGAIELCNGHDDDCDELLRPDEVDADMDGLLLCAGDCDDADPAQTEVCEVACDQPGAADQPACTGGAGESASVDDLPGEFTGGGAGDVGGCTCDAARTTWPTALLLPWLLLGARRRRVADRRLPGRELSADNDNATNG